MDKPLLTLVVPVYNEQETIEIFLEECEKTEKLLPDLTVEYLFVNDGSADRTKQILRTLSEKYEKVHYLSFSRNFGKEAAIYAGLQHAEGDYVAIMDVDLQDPPSFLPEMYRSVKEEGYDSVGCRRVERKGEPIIRSFFARMFYKIINKVSKVKIADGARDFQFMTRKVRDAIVSMGEYNRFSKGIFEWIGFKKKWMEYENVERVAGETKWSFWGLLLYAIDGIMAFSTAPLAIASFIGLLFCFIAFVMIVVIIVKTLLLGDPTSGWPSLVCIILLVSGVQLFCIGIVGQYLAKTYLETKRRPIYIIEETDLQEK